MFARDSQGVLHAASHIKRCTTFPSPYLPEAQWEIRRAYSTRSRKQSFNLRKYAVSIQSRRGPKSSSLLKLYYDSPENL